MKNIICKILFIFLAASFIFANAAKAEPFAVTSLGPVQGVNQRGVEVFKGIPFAQSPTGTLRFAPPKPVDSFPDTYMATTFCPIPVQPGFVSHDPMKMQLKTACALIFSDQKVQRMEISFRYTYGFTVVPLYLEHLLFQPTTVLPLPKTESFSLPLTTGSMLLVSTHQKRP